MSLFQVIPNLVEDINDRMDDWGKNGKMNPFKEMHDVRFCIDSNLPFYPYSSLKRSQLVFQMTVRMGTCRELADNRQATARLSELFLLHEQATSPISLLLPWLPGRDKKTKETATRGLFDILSNYVDLRRKSNVQSNDGIDLLIATGYDDATTISVSTAVFCIFFWFK